MGRSSRNGGFNGQNIYNAGWIWSWPHLDVTGIMVGMGIPFVSLSWPYFSYWIVAIQPIHWLSIMFIQVPSFSHLFLNKLYWLGINLEGYTPLLSPWPKHDIGKSAVMIRMRRPLGADSVENMFQMWCIPPRLRHLAMTCHDNKT